MKKFLTVIALGAVALVSADQYYQTTCPNCPNYRNPNGNYTQRDAGQYPQITNQDPGFDEQVKRQESRDGYQINNPSNDQPSNDGYYDQKKVIQSAKKDTTEAYKTKSDNTYAGMQTADKNFPNDTATTTQDRQINSKIRDRLNGGWFSKGNQTLVLRTNNGVVIISGNVDKADELHKIVDQIREIEGVRSVNSQLTVKNRY